MNFFSDQRQLQIDIEGAERKLFSSIGDGRRDLSDSGARSILRFNSYKSR